MTPVDADIMSPATSPVQRSLFYISYLLAHSNQHTPKQFSCNDHPTKPMFFPLLVKSLRSWIIPETCLLSNDIHDYHYVSQGKTEIPGVDDGGEFKDTDVSCYNRSDGRIDSSVKLTFTNKLSLPSSIFYPNLRELTLAQLKSTCVAANLCDHATPTKSNLYLTK